MHGLPNCNCARRSWDPCLLCKLNLRSRSCGRLQPFRASTDSPNNTQPKKILLNDYGRPQEALESLGGKSGVVCHRLLGRQTKVWRCWHRLAGSSVLTVIAPASELQTHRQHRSSLSLLQADLGNRVAAISRMSNPPCNLLVFLSSAHEWSYIAAGVHLPRQ